MSDPDHPERVDALLVDTARDVPAINTLAELTSTSWALEFGDELLASIEWLEDTTSIMVSAGLGLWPSERVSSLYPAMLSYNLLWRETGGVHLGQAGADGEIVIQLHIPTCMLERERLAVALGNFIESALWWHELLRSDEPVPGQAQGEPGLQAMRDIAQRA